MSRTDAPARLRVESYKPSGKYYSSGVVDFPLSVQYLDARGFVAALPKLPGLSCSPGSWDGYYVIGSDDAWDDWHSFLVDCSK